MINGTKAFITNSGTDITGWSSASPRSPASAPTAGRRSPRSSCPSGTPGFTVGRRVLQGRLERLRHPRAVLRRLPGARPRTCSASAAGATRSSCRSSTRAASRSPPSRSAWPRAAWTSRLRYVRERAGVRPPDRPLPGHPVQDRRHGGPRPHRPAGLLRRGREDAGRRAVQEGGGHRQARRRRRGHGQRPRRHPDLRRLRVHERVPGRPASTATPRSWRSARAPARSSGCSSPGSSA